MPKVSVIMPSLNVAKYIGECMESVVKQTLSDIEIIVIDAGSTDGTLEILEEYASRDSRIKLLHSEMKSYGHQMNMGVRQATGEYIGIVETDDVIEADMFEVLYNRIVGTDAKYIKACATGFYELSFGKEYTHDIISCGDFCEDESLQEVELDPREHTELFITDNFLWYGIYERKFFSQIEFHETPGAAFQDIPVLFRTISSADKAIYLRKSVYNYRKSNSAASSYNHKSLGYTATEYKHLKEYALSLSPKWINMYYKKMMMLCLDRYDYMALEGAMWEESKEGLEWIVDEFKKALQLGLIDYDDLVDFLQDRARGVVDDCYKELENHIERYKAIKAPYLALKSFCQEKQGFIFGAGYVGSYISTFLASANVPFVQNYVDNSPEKQGQCVNGYEIISLDAALKLNPDASFVIANLRHADDIRKQLVDNGISEDRITVFNAPFNMLMLLV